MDRHFESIHEGAGLICGDCENERIQSSIKRKDHFKKHLQKDHGCKKATWEDFKKCPWPVCQPANQKQARWFSTQSSLKQHILKEHEGKIPELSRQTEDGLSSFPDSQGK
jgi:hypothetical protein